MAQTKTLSQLVLKEYYRSRTDPNAFEWVDFSYLNEFLETISPNTAEWSDIGTWIFSLDVAKLINSCSKHIKGKYSKHIKGYYEEYSHLPAALTIAVLAGSEELGAVIASRLKQGDLNEFVTPMYARAAEILAAFSPELLPYLRATVKSANEQFLLELPGQENSSIIKPLISAAGLLLRHGTDDDWVKIRRVIYKINRRTTSYPLLCQYCTAAFDVDNYFVADLFEDLQTASFPIGTEQNINFFCELAAKTGVAVDFETLETDFEYGWIEGILHRMLRDPKRFEAQADALYAVLAAIRDDDDCGTLGGVVYARFKGTGKALQHVFGEPEQWLIPAAAYLAALDDYTPEYFSERAATETDPDSILVLRFLGSQCSPKTPQLDLSLVHLVFRLPELGRILLYDPRLRAPRHTFLGLFQAAVAGEEVSDAECVLLLDIAERYRSEKHMIGGSVWFEDHTVRVSERVGGDLVHAVIEYGGAQTRALLLHWLLLWGSEKVTRDTLLVLIAYLDGPKSWIEPILHRFFGVDQTVSFPWLQGDEALLIEGFRGVPQHDLEGIARAMTETELYRRPGLISQFWEAPHVTLWMDAWRLSSTRPGFHPLLSSVESENADGTSRSTLASPVAIACRFLTDGDLGILQPDRIAILRDIEPETGWLAPIQAVIDAKARVNFRIPATRQDIHELQYTKKGAMLSRAWVLSVMSVDQPGDKLDDQALLKPKWTYEVGEGASEVEYKLTVDRLELEYTVSLDLEGPADSCQSGETLIMKYGPQRYMFHIDESHRATHKSLHESSFEITGPEDLTMLREFSDRVVGAAISKSCLTVYINEGSFREAGVEHFGDAGDITGLNALYAHFGKPNPYFVQGWIVWGTLESVTDESGNETFRWDPDDFMNTWMWDDDEVEEDEVEWFTEKFGEIPKDQYVDIKRKFVLKDEEQIRENFRQWGIECGDII